MVFTRSAQTLESLIFDVASVPAQLGTFSSETDWPLTDEVLMPSLSGWCSPPSADLQLPELNLSLSLDIAPSPASATDLSPSVYYSAVLQELGDFAKTWEEEKAGAPDVVEDDLDAYLSLTPAFPQSHSDPVLYQHEAFAPQTTEQYSSMQFCLSSTAYSDTGVSPSAPSSFSLDGSATSESDFDMDLSPPNSPVSSFTSFNSETKSQPALEPRSPVPHFHPILPAPALPTLQPAPSSPTLSKKLTFPNLPPLDSLPPVVAKALSHRLNCLAEDSLPFNPFRAPDPQRKPRSASDSDRRKNSKPFEVPSICWTCGDALAKLVLRGVVDDSAPPRVSYNCIACQPVTEGGEAVLQRGGAGYEGTLSAAVDLALGLEVDARGLTRQPTMNDILASAKDDALVCDVCSAVIGSGGVVKGKNKTPQGFTIEVICTSCTIRYSPCTDCGGGGGRLTAGRWRCKELFPKRKTCQLSHLRNPPLGERTFEVFRTADLNPTVAEALADECRKVYFNTRLGAMARPELLERGDGLVKNYDQCFNSTVDLWNLLSPLVTQDVTEPNTIRRYIGTQTSAPHKRRATAKHCDDGADKEVMAGFTLVEHDLVNGSIFFAESCPWATSGHASEAASFLNDETVQLIQRDLDTLNAERRAAKLPLYPQITCTWLVSAFRTDGKLMHSNSRKGYVPLEEYLEANPGVGRDTFPPEREIFLPRDFLAGQTIWVRPIDGSEGGAPPKATSRRRK